MKQFIQWVIWGLCGGGLLAQTPLLSINDEKISLEAFQQSQQANLQTLGVDKSLEIFTEFELLQQYALDNGAEQDVAFLTPYQLALSKLQDEQLISPEKLEPFLNKYRTLFATEYKVQIIYALPKNEALVNAALKKGVDFGKIIADYSENKEFLTPRYIPFEFFDETYLPLLQSLKVGAVSKPIVLENHLMWIKKVSERKNLGIVSFQRIYHTNADSINLAYQEIQKGEDFSKVLQTYSQEKNQNGGVMSNVYQGMPDEVYEQVKNLPVNGYSKVFPYGNKYFIYKVLKKTDINNAEESRAFFSNYIKNTEDYFNLMDENVKKVEEAKVFTLYSDNINQFIESGPTYYIDSLNYSKYNKPLFSLEEFKITEENILSQLKETGVEAVDSKLINMMIGEVLYNYETDYYTNYMFFQEERIRPQVLEIKKALLINYTFDKLILNAAVKDSLGMMNYIKQNPEKYTLEPRADMEIYNTVDEKTANEVMKWLKKNKNKNEIIKMYASKLDAKNRPFVFTEDGKVSQKSEQYPKNVPFKKGVYINPEKDGRFQVVLIKSIIPSQLMSYDEAKLSLLETYQNVYYKNLVSKLKNEADIVVNPEALQKLKSTFPE